MKTIGIIGGLGPASTLKYYEWLTDGVQKKMGGANSAKIIMVSLNGEEIKNFRMAKDVEGEGALFKDAAQKLEQAGADFILIASNTSHKNAEFVENNVSIPLLHLADTTADKVLKSGVRNIALLGTFLTMEHDFYKDRLKAKGLKVIVPEAQERAYISDEIYNHLIKGDVRDQAVRRFQEIIAKLQAAGAEGVILGCTELTLLNLNCDDGLSLFDTTKIHVQAALEQALD